MRLKTIIFFLGLACSLVAQDYATIDGYALNVPKSKTNTPADLAEYLNKQAKGDLEKVRAYYVWITHHVAYDTKSFFSGKSGSESSPETTLKKRNAVCQGYAELFKALCDYGNISCFVVDGYSKGFGYKPGKKFTSTDHAWNLVFVNNKWQPIDATWGAGFVNRDHKFEFHFNEENFLADPKQFIFKHLPADPMWQLLPCPLTMDEYLQNEEEINLILKENKTCSYSFPDTINNYLQLKKNERMISSAERAYRFYPKNTDAVGYAYLNFAYDLGLQLPPLFDNQEFTKALELSQTILQLNEKAMNYFKAGNTENSKNAYNIAKQNIASMKNSIKSLEEYLK